MSARLRPFRSGRSEIPSLLPDSWSIATWRHPVVLADSLEHAADIGEILRERGVAPEGSVETLHAALLGTRRERDRASYESVLPALDADLLVVVVGGSDGVVSPVVRSWLRRWLVLREPGRDGMLLAWVLAGTPAATAAAAGTYLEVAAKAAGMTFRTRTGSGVSAESVGGTDSQNLSTTGWVPVVVEGGRGSTSGWRLEN